MEGIDEPFKSLKKDPKTITIKEFLKQFPFLSKMSLRTKLIGRKQELELLEESLYKKRMRNCVLVGNAGVGKTTIVEQIAENLKNYYYIVQFDVAGSVAGTKYRGEFEQRIIDVLNIIKKVNETKAVGGKEVILFIDEIHTLYKAGGAEGAIDASNIFKPYLSRGEITVIGATTLEEYNETIKKDAALSRRLPAIYIGDMTEAQIKKILQNFSEGTVNDIGIDYIYKKSLTIPNSHNPDISIEILDRCMARSKCRGVNITSEMVDNIVSYMVNCN